MLDERDRKLLSLLQHDSETPAHVLAEAVHLSVSAVSRRLTRLKSEGYIERLGAVLNRQKLNIAMTVYVLIKTAHHSADWLERFRKVLESIPEIVEAHRLAGNLDYSLKIVARDVAHYDKIYKALVSGIDLFEVSAYISMETLKEGHSLPTHYAS